MHAPVMIDGSQGEGGGQILRSSLALSLVTGRPFVIDNIRAGRGKPGLMRQHLTAVLAAAEVGAAELEGAAIGSRRLSFTPTTIRSGSYRFGVGTAGSTTLVLQTLLPALVLADGPSEIVLEGGTHNTWAPPFHFLERAYLPLLNRMGPQVSVRLERYGFYPVGGGRLSVQIQPAKSLMGFHLVNRGETKAKSVCALVANLPAAIGEREVKEVLRRMSWPSDVGCVLDVGASGPGNVVFIEIESAHVTEVFTGFGRLGTKSEHVAGEAWREARTYLASDAVVGPYLSDQLLPLLGVSAWRGDSSANVGGRFRTGPLTRHSTTQIETIQAFLGVQIVASTVDNHGRMVDVDVRPG